jgi:hypothetical protein
MSDTAQLFTLAGIWTLVAAFLVYFIANWPARIGLFAVMVGIPFWEVPFGFQYFKSLCDMEGGLRTFEAVPPQKIICLKHPIENLAPHFLSLGVPVVEKVDQNGRLSVLPADSRSGEGQSSAYCVSQGFVDNLPWRIQRNEFAVLRVSDGRLVGRFSDFIWYGTWWQQAALPVLGRGGECRHGDPVPSIVKWLVTGVK